MKEQDIILVQELIPILDNGVRENIIRDFRLSISYEFVNIAFTLCNGVFKNYDDYTYSSRSIDSMVSACCNDLLQARKNMNILFLAIDLQNDFISPNGALPVPGANDIKDNVLKIQEYINDSLVSFCYTKDWHKTTDEEISDNPDFINTFPAHCIEYTLGAELIYEINNLTGGSHIIKNKFSMFKGSEHALDKLKSLKPKDIYIFGVSGDVCVKEAIDGLIENKGIIGFNTIYIITDCIASINQLRFDNYVTDIMTKYDYIKLTTCDKIVMNTKI